VKFSSIAESQFAIEMLHDRLLKGRAIMVREDRNKNSELSRIMPPFEAHQNFKDFQQYPHEKSYNNFHESREPYWNYPNYNEPLNYFPSSVKFVDKVLPSPINSSDSYRSYELKNSIQPGPLNTSELISYSNASNSNDPYYLGDTSYNNKNYSQPVDNRNETLNYENFITFVNSRLNYHQNTQEQNFPFSIDRSRYSNNYTPLANFSPYDNHNITKEEYSMNNSMPYNDLTNRNYNNYNYNNSKANRMIFVGNLDFSVNSSELYELMSKVGEIISANVIYEGTRSKGYGIVEYATEISASDAIKHLNNTSLKGRCVYIRRDVKKS
jgi:RNA recognition motif-containing protein